MASLEDLMHCASWSCWNWHEFWAWAWACGGAPSVRWTTSVWRGPITASTARLATAMPVPMAMPEAMEPMRPDSMPPPDGATAGGAAAGAAAGGGARCWAGGGACAAGAERFGPLLEVRAPERGMIQGCLGRVDDCYGCRPKSLLQHRAWHCMVA